MLRELRGMEDRKVGVAPGRIGDDQQRSLGVVMPRLAGSRFLIGSPSSVQSALTILTKCSLTRSQQR